MKSLGWGLLLFSCISCAADPDYATGQGGSGATAGTTGNAGTSASVGSTGSGGMYVPPGLTIAHPNPIISRSKAVMSAPDGGGSVVNGTYHNGGWNAGTPTDAAPAWVAINLGAGPTRILVSWDDGGTYNYQPFRNKPEPAYGYPAAYHFEVSADGTTWAAVGTPVTGNHVRTRAHAFDFTGKAWIKMVITGAPMGSTGPTPVKISEIDVHDISATGTGMPDDTWFFMGDSITAFAYQRTDAQQPSLAKGISAAVPPYFPAMINGGVGGELTADALNRLDEDLALNPDYRFFALGYGTNDAAGNRTDTGVFRSNLQTLITRLKAANRVPILARIPYSNDNSHNTVATFNAVIDDLTRQNGLQIGPDFFAYFMQHTDQLDGMDHLHPTIDGQKAMNPLWTAAARPLYPSP